MNDAAAPAIQIERPVIATDDGRSFDGYLARYLQRDVGRRAAQDRDGRGFGTNRLNSSVRTREYLSTAEIERAPPAGPDDELLFGRRSRLWHQEPHDRGAKQAYRRHTQKCCRPIKIRGDQAKECSAERSTNS